MSPPFAWDYYNKKNNHCNLRGKHLSKLDKCRTKAYGLNTAVWNKTLIREWTQISCTCCICHIYLFIYLYIC